MKTFHIFISLFCMLTPVLVFSQYTSGCMVQLFTDPTQYALGKANLGLGANVGMYDRFRPDYGFRISGMGWSLPGITDRGETADLQNWYLNAGVQVYPFGIRDHLFFPRRSFSKRARFHHQLKVMDRIKTCGSSCYDPRGPGISQLLRGFHAGIGYEYSASERTGDYTGQTAIRHGLNLEVGYALSLEFLWFGIIWRPIGVYSPELTKTASGYLPPQGPKETGKTYEQGLSIQIGIALCN